MIQLTGSGIKTTQTNQIIQEILTRQIIQMEFIQQSI